MMIAPIVQSLAKAAKPWAALYGDNVAVLSAVTFAHIIGLLFAGGLAVSSDRATLRASRGNDEDRTRLLTDLGSSHGWVIGWLSLTFVSGLLLALSDVKTFATSWVYWTKMGLIVLLLLNGAVLQRTEQGLRASPALPGNGARNGSWSRLRFTAVISLTLWVLIVLAGVVLVEAS